MGINCFFKKAIISFTGERFYLSRFKGEKYLTDVSEVISLYSESPISDKSMSYRGIFDTEVDPKELEDITLAKLFIKYKGNEYEAWDVAVGFEEVLLNVRKGHEKEDIEENGFECHQIDQYTRWINRWIKKEEIEDIRIEETSVYEEFLNKYGN